MTVSLGQLGCWVVLVVVRQLLVWWSLVTWSKLTACVRRDEKLTNSPLQNFLRICAEIAWPQAEGGSYLSLSDSPELYEEELTDGESPTWKWMEWWWWGLRWWLVFLWCSCCACYAWCGAASRAIGAVEAATRSFWLSAVVTVDLNI